MMLPLVLLLACREAPPSRPNFLVVDLDTLRADRIGRERNGASITPHIDALAARGVRFDQMIAQSGWTLPSLAALLTGRLPLGVLQRVPAPQVEWIAADARTLPEILGLYGYQTAVFYGATLPATFPAMSRGFAEHGEPPAAKPDGDAAREVVQWLDRSPKEPWLAVVHTADLHLMGDVPHDDVDLYAPDHPPPCVEQGSLAYPLLVDTWATTLGRPAAEELLRAHYDAVVHHYDADVGEMVKALERDGVRSHTVVVVLSDHGQELLEHGNADHGPPYEFNLRVPLVIDDPTHPRGVRVPTMVQTIDVAPTILDIAGVPVDAAMDGRSLVPLMNGGEGYVERPAVSITDPHRMAVRTPEWLLLRCQAAGCPRPRPQDASAVLELYDLAQDPTQLTNLAGTGLAVERELTPILDALPIAGRRKAVDDGMSAEQEKLLRERGYWDAGDASH